MRNQTKKGFVLTLVIVGLGMVAVVMFVLTGGANTMLFQADRAYLQAVRRNLVASGIAWSQVAAADPNAVPLAGPVQLDAAALGGRGPELTVRITEVRTETVDIQVRTSCTKGKQTLTGSRDYTIRLR